MSRFALGTNTLSYFMRGEGRVAQKLQAISPQQVAIPAIVAYEIRHGLSRSVRRPLATAFEHMLRMVVVLAFDADAAEHGADIRRRLDGAGTLTGPHDVLIAATARRYGCTLVTHNTREFARVTGLQIDDWY